MLQINPNIARISIFLFLAVQRSIVRIFPFSIYEFNYLHRNLTNILLEEKMKKKKNLGGTQKIPAHENIAINVEPVSLSKAPGIEHWIHEKNNEVERVHCISNLSSEHCSLHVLKTSRTFCRASLTNE